MCDLNADEKKRVEKGSLLALREIPRRSGSTADGMCTAGGRVREGNPPWYGQV